MTGYLVLVGLIALYALAAARVEHLLVTGPIMFVVIGFLFGTRGLSVVDPTTGSETRARGHRGDIGSLALLRCLERQPSRPAAGCFASSCCFSLSVFRSR